MMHDDQRRAALRRDLRHRRIGAQAGYVVDHGGAERERPARDKSLGGVHRDRRGEPREQRGQHGVKPRPFLRLGDGNEAGPGRFRADVNDVRAGGGHGPTMGERRLRRDETAAVGEGIRRDVEDAHDEGRGVEPGDQRVGRGPGFGVRIHRATWVHRRLG